MRFWNGWADVIVESIYKPFSCRNLYDDLITYLIYQASYSSLFLESVFDPNFVFQGNH